MDFVSHKSSEFLLEWEVFCLTYKCKPKKGFLVSMFLLAQYSYCLSVSLAILILDTSWLLSSIISEFNLSSSKFWNSMYMQLEGKTAERHARFFSKYAVRWNGTWIFHNIDIIYHQSDENCFLYINAVMSNHSIGNFHLIVEEFSSHFDLHYETKFELFTYDA